MNPLRTLRALTLTAACLVTVALVALASPVQAEPRHGIRLAVPCAVELPDGAVVPAGAMTIWYTHDLSPVTALHRIGMNGRTAAFAMSRMKRTELAGVMEPFALFHRNSSGVLRLIGYAWSDGRNARAYLLVSDGSSEAFLAELAAGRTASVDEVVIAASLTGTR